MNKYQKYFLKDDAYIDCFASGSDTNCSLDRTLDNGVVRIKQNEDISIKEYTLASRYPFDYFCKSKWQKSSKMENRAWHIVKFDWTTPIEKVRFLADNEFVEALELNIEYEFADVEAYNKKQELQRKNDLIAKASIKHSTGADLVNIYFQPCVNDYARAEIILFRDNMMLAKYKVDEECFFKSINGLAYGTYSFVMKQFDNRNNIVLETEHINFTISSPKHPTIGRQKGHVVIN